MKNTARRTASVLLLLLISFSGFTAELSCRKLVVVAHKSVGEEIEENSFSSERFESFRMTAAEFNALDLEAQEKIYMKVKPMEAMVAETINMLNRYISRYVGSPYELQLTDELEFWRLVRGKLRECKV